MPIFAIAEAAHLQVLRLALDAASLRHQLISANIAHASNPEWQPRKLDFEESLQAVLARGAPTAASLADARPRVLDDPAGGALDTQMLALSRNVIHYQALLKASDAGMELLSLASSDGRR